MKVGKVIKRRILIMNNDGEIFEYDLDLVRGGGSLQIKLINMVREYP